MKSEPESKVFRATTNSIQLLLSLTSFLLMTACGQMPYHQVQVAASPAWATQSVNSATDVSWNAGENEWWKRLQDPAIDSLVVSALLDSPDLAQAMARIDSARATLGVAGAQTSPTLTGNAAVTRTSSQVSSTSSATQEGSLGTVGLGLTWEIDLYGRLRAGREAAQERLDARSADARNTQISLVAQIADRVLSWRACTFSAQIQQGNVNSFEKALELTERRVAVGVAMPLDSSHALRDLASARAGAMSQADSCKRDLNALVYLSGLDADAVTARLVAESRNAQTPVTIPDPPAAQLAIPAIVLETHPNIVSAQREVAAAWSEIGAARANRYPRLDLGALLTGQWMSVGGQSLNFTTWSMGPSLSGVIADGGASTAQVDGAEARYREVAARAIATVRASVQDIENALVSIASSKERQAPIQQALNAAKTGRQIAEVQWESGSGTLLNLEDARRQYATAQSIAVIVARDRSQAWVALVRATANPNVAFPSSDKDN